MSKVFVLPQGIRIAEDDVLRELPIAPTTGEAEKVFTRKPNNQTLYTWFGRLISAAVEEINGVPVSAPFLKDASKTIPDAVRDISMPDVGSLLLQIQCECWQDTIENQQIRCTSCGTNLIADVELRKIPIEVPEEPHPDFVEVSLGTTYKIQTGLEAFSEWEGLTYDTAVFRVPLLRDALKYEKIAQNEVEFWRKVSMDCLLHLKNSETGEVISPEYVHRRGALLMNEDWNTVTLKNVCYRLLTGFPTVKFFYA